MKSKRSVFAGLALVLAVVCGSVFGEPRLVAVKITVNSETIGGEGYFTNRRDYSISPGPAPSGDRQGTTAHREMCASNAFFIRSWTRGCFSDRSVVSRGSSFRL